MKQIPFWEEIEENSNYGAYWKAKGITGERLENLIASEVHSRLAGKDGEAIFMDLAKQKGTHVIIRQVKQEDYNGKPQITIQLHLRHAANTHRRYSRQRRSALCNVCLDAGGGCYL